MMLASSGQRNYVIESRIAPSIAPGIWIAIASANPAEIAVSFNNHVAVNRLLAARCANSVVPGFPHPVVTRLLACGSINRPRSLFASLATTFFIKARKWMFDPRKELAATEAAGILLLQAGMASIPSAHITQPLLAALNLHWRLAFQAPHLCGSSTSTMTHLPIALGAMPASASVAKPAAAFTGQAGRG